MLAVPAASAHAEIYKCPAYKGMTVYQNFPCEVDSLGAMATAPNATVGAQGDERALAKRPGNAMHASKLSPAHAARSVPVVGMTASEVKAIWGAPKESSKEEFAKGDVETWTYADSRVVKFDQKGRVTGIHW